MKAVRRAWSRIRGMFSGRRHEQELADEIAAHIAMQTEDNIRSGMDPESARRTAVLKFGGVAGVKEGWRDQRRWPWVEALWADVRYAARGLHRNPGLTAAVALTLALGIGANVAIFSVVYNVLLRPLPYPEADRLVRIYSTHLERGGRVGSSIPDFFDWQRAASFEAMEALPSGRVTFVDGDPGQRVSAYAVTPGFLHLIGARPRLGRLISDEDARADAPPVVLLAHEFWLSRFGGDPGVVGQSIHLGQSRLTISDGAIIEEMDVTVYTVIGVAEPIQDAMGRPLDGARPVQVIFPWAIETHPNRSIRDARILPVVARLRPGVSLANAQEELDRIGGQLREEYPQNASWTPLGVSLYEEIVSDVRPPLMALMGATGLILLIAVSNAANLLLARGKTRQPEFSVRAALGAGRVRLARLLLTESVLLSLLGGVVGIGLGYAGMRLFLVTEPSWLPRAGGIALDGIVLGATLGVTLISGIFFGLLPALFLRDVPWLKGPHTIGEPGGGRGWLSSGLVVTQLTLSLVLLTGSGLMIRSFLNLKNAPVGIDYRQIVTFALGWDGWVVGPATATRTAQLQRLRQALTEVQAVSGVRDATLTSQAPLNGGAGGTGIQLLGEAGGVERNSVELVGVAENFFEFFGGRAVAGRLFESADAARADDVVVVDANLAEILWPGEPAVGRRIRIGLVESEVIGVAEPIRYGRLDEDMRPKMFHLLNRSGDGMYGTRFLVRHDGDPKAILKAIETRLQEFDASLRPLNPAPLGEQYDQYLREPRFYLLLLGSLGALALAVAVVGVYGVVAYAVTRRTAEISLRLALGAQRTQIAGMFCRRTFLLLAIGLGLGLLGSVWLTQYIESLLFQIEPTDPATLGSMVVLLAAAAVTATWIPVRLALRVDPAATLRSE